MAETSIEPQSMFVLSSHNFEYDDESHYSTDGVTPEEVYSTFEAAEAARKAKEARTFKGLNVGDYGSDLSCLTGMEESAVIAKLREIGLEVEDDEDFTYFEIPADITDEQALKVAEVFNYITFYSVQKVPVVG